MKKAPTVVAILLLLLVPIVLILLSLNEGGLEETANSDVARGSERGGIGRDATQPASPDHNVPGSIEESGRPLVVVSPLYGLDELLDGYAREVYADAEENVDFEIIRKNWLDLRRAGGTRWGSQNWMQDPEYYHGLGTDALVLECFSRPIFYMELSR